MDRASRSVRLAAPVVATVLALFVPSIVAHAADITLDIPEIPGESTSAPGQIDILTFQFSVASPATAKPVKTSTVCGAKEKTAKVNEITLTKNTDKSTPKLAEAASNGKFFSEVEIHFTTTVAGPAQEYLKYKLTNAIITSVRAAAQVGQEPTETVVFAFQGITATYTKPGDPATTATSTWDACALPGP